MKIRSNLVLAFFVTFSMAAVWRPCGVWADLLGPVVRITSPDPSAGLSEAGGVFGGTAVDADGVSCVRIYVFDEFQGRFTVANAKAALNASTGAWSFAVQAAQISPGGPVRLWAQAKDRQGNLSAWTLARVLVSTSSVPDTEPPELAITEPSASPVSTQGFRFAGRVSDPSGLAAVRIYVFDELRGSFTVANAAAVVDAAAGTWRFDVQASHVTPGGPVRLWVQAADTLGNTTTWQLSRVLAAGIQDLGPSLVSVQGPKLYVARRKPDGTLGPLEPFLIRGVNYSPVDPGQTVDSLAAARAHLRQSSYVGDFALMQELGANAVRTFADVGTDAVALQFLDAAYQRGLFVMVSLIDLAPAEVSAVVAAYRRHPALLGWIIGNEWNLNRFFDPARFQTLPSVAAAVEDTARLVRSLDPDHPVASSLGFSDDGFNLGPEILQHPLPSLVAAAPSVQLWGFNLYRGRSLEPFFAEWDLVKRASGFAGPVFLTEFGTDSWNFFTGRQDETLQAETDAAIWDALHRHGLGGFVMEWNDEWWKAGAPSVQSADGFRLSRTIFHPATGLALTTFLGHPDGFSNEEHYGLVDIARRRKAAFFAVRDAYALGTLITEPVPLEVTSSGSGASGWALFVKQGAPVYAGVQEGFYLGVLSRSTGTFETLRRFNTVGDPVGECQALREYSRTLSNADVVVVGVSQSGLPEGAAMGDAALRPCLEALQGLGAARALELGPRQPWALIARAGSPPSNLAEGLGAMPDTVRVSVSIELDADGDGIPDAQDPDNDNDGLTDAQERALGRDILAAGR